MDLIDIRPSAEPQPVFLPMYPSEQKELGWDEIDVLIITGDAYIDHPAFGAALIGRVLAARGYRVGLIAQPRWDNPGDIVRLGRPRLFAGVTAGALDSMLAHYTAFRKIRRDDAYTPGGKAGARPNRAATVYANLVRQAFPGLPVALGGIEASLRRAAHYDFWTDKLRRSILLDSKADVLLYGMAERSVVALADELAFLPPDSRALTPALLSRIPGAVFAAKPAELSNETLDNAIRLPSYEDIQADPAKLVEAALLMERQVHLANRWAIQETGGRSTMFAPPPRGLTSEEMDRLYDLPFARAPHPSYTLPIPAAEMLETSVTSHRGCGGGCAFCSLALHQGRRVQSRSRESILRETAALTQLTNWRGSVTDVGGPSANMWGASCRTNYDCERTSCLHPAVCPNLTVDQKGYVHLLEAVREMPKVKHVRAASGLRFDLALKEPEALAELVGRFVGGQMKVAPEHICDDVLDAMRKPGRKVFMRFMEVFETASRQANKEQYLVPYLMSGLPGCTDRHMAELADWLKARGWKPRQVQCFIPTPGTVATAMYYAGVDARNRPIHVARTDKERLRQHRVLVGEADEPSKTRRKGPQPEKKQHRNSRKRIP